MQQINNTLYALNKDDSFQKWKVFTDGSNVIVEFGKVGGKIQTKVTECDPKNVGRANETTGEQQAIAEAISKWQKQVRLGYRETVEELETQDQFSPMLAHDAIKRSKDIIYPCHVQPKLDGLRCLVTFDEQDQPIFNSRGNKTYPIQGKIIEQIKELRKATGFDMFDGEMYLHGLSLQKISSLAKKWRTHEQINAEIEKDYQADIKRRNKAIDNKEPTWKDFNGEVWTTAILPVRDTMRYDEYESTDLEFHIFDIPSKGKVWDSDNGYADYWNYNDHPCRYADLMNTDSIVYKLDLSKIKIVHGSFMEDEDQTKDAIGTYMQLGYEGAIIRNFKGLYEFGQRSTDLQKWKIFQDGEAKVTGYVIDKNKEAVLECIEKDGTTFKCKMKGTFLERNEEAGKNLVGKFINFTFQARTDDGVPQFAVGQCVRDVNPETWEVLE